LDDAPLLRKAEALGAFLSVEREKVRGGVRTPVRKKYDCSLGATRPLPNQLDAIEQLVLKMVGVALLR
jgi:hypothetical protein